MALITMVFEFPYPINESLQAGNPLATPPTGDDVYYSVTQLHGGFNTTDPNITGTFDVYVGKCSLITFNTGSGLWEVHALMDPGFTVNQQTAIQNTYNAGTCFIRFSKDTEANRSSLLGYYAEVKLGNDSGDIAELFAVSTEAVQSSK